jgi:alanyl-tRNA synthetase
MMTDLLHMLDFDVVSATAKVVAIEKAEDDRFDVVLDRTCFYARGGGQDWDYGTISAEGSVCVVQEVRLDTEGIVHHIGSLESGMFTVGDEVQCNVEVTRRAVNTRLHSAGHALDMAIDSLGLEWVSTKGQHYPELCAVEYTGAWDEAAADEVRVRIEAKTNELIQAGFENSFAFMPVVDMQKCAATCLPTYLRTNREELSCTVKTSASLAAERMSKT